MVKKPPANARDSGDAGFTPGSGRFPGDKGDTGIEMKTYKKVYIGAFISVCTGCSEGLFLIQGAMRKWGKE